MSYYPGMPTYPNAYAPYVPPYPNWMPPGPMPQQAQQGPQMPALPQQAQAPQPMPTAQPAQQTAQPQQFSGITWVQGEAGAKGFQVDPGKSALLMDSEASTFYLKSADMNGMPSMRTFDYSERSVPAHPPMQAQQAAPDYITRQEFAALAEEVRALKAPAAAGGADRA